jgi:hypothetical protein
MIIRKVNVPFCLFLAIMLSSCGYGKVASYSLLAIEDSSELKEHLKRVDPDQLAKGESCAIYLGRPSFTEAVDHALASAPTGTVALYNGSATFSWSNYFVYGRQCFNVAAIPVMLK